MDGILSRNARLRGLSAERQSAANRLTVVSRAPQAISFRVWQGNQTGRGQLLRRVDVAYIVGLEARGLSPHARRATEGGEIELVEWSNYALAVRLKAAAMGLPFLPARSMLGTDTYQRSAAKKIAWGAMAWGGQWCTSPGYAYVHESIAEQHRALARKLKGHCAYYGITGNAPALARFRYEIHRAWQRWLVRPGYAFRKACWRLRVATRD